MKHAVDMRHPLTDEFAAWLFYHTPHWLWSEIGVEVPRDLPVWEKAEPTLRDFFRDRARRFIDGDDGVLPWRMLLARGMTTSAAFPHADLVEISPTAATT